MMSVSSHFKRICDALTNDKKDEDIICNDNNNITISVDKEFINNRLKPRLFECECNANKLIYGYLRNIQNKFFGDDVSTTI